MANRLSLSPAYGRDYKRKADVVADWNAGKDFFNNGIMAEGRYVNKPDAERLGVQEVNIRYKGLTQVCVIKVARG